MTSTQTLHLLDNIGIPRATSPHLTRQQMDANLHAFLAKEGLACPTCEHGCTCQAGTPGCEHYACWGTP